MALALAGLISMSALPQTKMTSFGASLVEQKGKALYDLGLLQGYSTDKMELGLADSLTREQAIKLTMTFLGYADKDLDKDSNSDFTDVKKGSAWAKPWVQKATELGITTGISKTEFGYGQPVTKHQLTTFMLRALGYEKAWEKAADLGLDLELLKAADLSDFNDASIRGDFASIGYSTLLAELYKKDQTLIERLVEQKIVDLELAKKFGLIKTTTENFEVASMKVLNLAETQITFTKNIEDQSISEENYKNFKVNNKSVKGIEKIDDKTIILFHEPVNNGDKAKLEIRDIKDTKGNKLDKTSEELRYVDRELPTLDKAEVVGSKTIRLTFSKAMKDDKGKFNISAFKITKENGSKVYIKEAKPVGNHNRQVDLTLLSSLEEQEYTIKVTPDITDYAGFGLVDTVTVDVKKDTEAPQIVGYKKASETGVTLIFNEDILDHNAEEADFYHTNSKNQVDTKGFKIKGNELTLTFTKNELPQGTAYVFIKENALKDLWGNKISVLRYNIEIDEDKEAPIIESVKQGTGNKELIIEFKEEDLNVSEAKKKANYLLEDNKGETIDLASVAVSGKKVTLSFKKEVAGDVALTVKNLKDLKGNKMDTQDFVVNFVDKSAPEFPNKVTVFTTSDEYILRIKFKENGGMAEEGSYSVLDKDKYQLTYNDNVVKELKDIEDAQVRILEDGISVEVVLPKASLKNFKSFTNLSVARVADREGNKTELLVKKFAAGDFEEAKDIRVMKAEATDKNQIKVTMDSRLDNVEFEDFVIYKYEVIEEDSLMIGSPLEWNMDEILNNPDRIDAVPMGDISNIIYRNREEQKIGSSDVQLDKDGRTVLIFNLEKEFGANPVGYILEVKGQKSTNEYQVPVALMDMKIKDKVAPSLEKETTEKENASRDTNLYNRRHGFVLVFDEEIKLGQGELAVTDLKVTNLDKDKTLVPGNDFNLQQRGKRVYVELRGEHLDDRRFEISVNGAKYLQDTNDNKVKDFDVTIERQFYNGGEETVDKTPPIILNYKPTVSGDGRMRIEIKLDDNDYDHKTVVDIKNYKLVDANGNPINISRVLGSGSYIYVDFDRTPTAVVSVTLSNIADQKGNVMKETTLTVSFER